MRGLKGKSAIVTGGSRGIGRAVVERLLEEEVKVLFTGRKTETGERVLSELKQKYITPVYFMAGDMGDENFCIASVKEAVAKFEGLDYLVNNAFPFTAKAFDATREDWLHSMEAGPIAFATMIQYYAKFRGTTAPGSIVNIGSIAGHIPDKGRWTYCAAKGAVNMITRCAALDLAPAVRVNGISAGCVWTEEVYKGKGGNPDRTMDEPVFRHQHLIDRVIMPEEMAASVAYLLSDESKGMTGSDMRVDGGYLVLGPHGWKYDPDWTGSSD